MRTITRLLSSLAATCDFFFFRCSGDHRDLHSFPTRRSSDLLVRQQRLAPAQQLARAARQNRRRNQRYNNDQQDRSEEHTSELQSQSNLVCRLLLEKKKKRYQTYSTHATTSARSCIETPPHTS